MLAARLWSLSWWNVYLHPKLNWFALCSVTNLWGLHITAGFMLRWNYTQVGYLIIWWLLKATGCSVSWFNAIKGIQRNNTIFLFVFNSKNIDNHLSFALCCSLNSKNIKILFVTGRNVKRVQSSQGLKHHILSNISQPHIKHFIING